MIDHYSSDMQSQFAPAPSLPTGTDPLPQALGLAAKNIAAVAGVEDFSELANLSRRSPERQLRNRLGWSRSKRSMLEAGLLALMVLLLATGCSGGNRLADQSSADVLFPLDEKYSTAWFFEMDSVDNYTFYSNWSKTNWVPAYEGDPAVIGYQVTNEELFTGGFDPANGPSGNIAVRDALRESHDVASSELCMFVDADDEIVRCEVEYLDLQGDRTGLELLIRHTGNSGALIVLPGAEGEDYSLEYLQGEFESVPFGEARQKWLEN